ncbi:MAG: LeuA family protein [Bacillota bacterium]
MAESEGKPIWAEDGWWVSPFNFNPLVREALGKLPERVKLHDVTLRDGEQTPGVVFRKEEKVRIAQMLDELGVDRIEASFPAVSAEDVEATKQIVKFRPKAEVFVLSRASKSDVDVALECGVDGIILEVPVGTPRLKFQFPGWTEDDVINRAVEWGKYAKQKGLKVVLFPMDCTRAEPEFFDRFLSEVSAKAQPDAITLVDTAGCLVPQAAMYLVKRMKEITGLPIEVHAHSDLGLGVATSLAAVAAGAEVVHVSAGGLGERTGNTALEEVAVALRVLYGVQVGIDFSKLTPIVRSVCEIARFGLATNKPIVGERAFTRESGLGIDLIRKQPLALFCVNPNFVGQEPKYVLGKKSGLPSVEMKLADMGIKHLTQEQKEKVLQRVKELALEKKGLVTDEEFLAIVKSV